MAPRLALVSTPLLLVLANAQLEAPGYPHGGGPCATEWDCSLGGVCNASSLTCVCDAWVTGPQCDLLNLAAPANENAGLQVPGYYSWGGHALLSPTDGLYHGLFSFMCRHATRAYNWTLWPFHSALLHPAYSFPAP